MDQLFAAMGFTDEAETPTAVEPTATRSIHEARRLRQAGDVDGALGVLAGADMAKAEKREVRWAFSEWKGASEAAVRRPRTSWSTARARAGPPRWFPSGEGMLEVAAVLGMRWRPGKVVSERSLRGLRPLAGGA